MKITTRMLKVLAPSVLAITLGLISLSIQAQTTTSSNDDVVKSINDFKIELMSWLDIARKEYYGILENAYKLDPAASTKPSVASDSSGLSAWVLKYTLPQIGQSLTQEGAANRVQALAAITASDTYVSSTPVFGTDPAKQKAALAAGNVNLSSESLLGRTVYFDAEDPANATRLANRAINYVVFATGLGEAPTSIDYSSLNDEQKKKLDSTEIGRQYKISLRSLVAARDLMANNLFSMLAKRVQQPGLGEKAGMSHKDASLLEVEEFVATRRAKSEKWHEDMQKAAPVVLQRETLYVLAEIQQQLMTLQQQNERILATLSVTAAQNLRVAKLMQAQKDLEVKQALGLASQGSALPEDISRQMQQEKAQADIEAAKAAQTQTSTTTAQ
jgi:hypothetical protein